MKDKFRSIAIAALAVLMAALSFTGCCCMKSWGRSCCTGTQSCCCKKCKPCHSKSIGGTLSVHADPSGAGVGVRAEKQ